MMQYCRSDSLENSSQSKHGLSLRKQYDLLKRDCEKNFTLATTIEEANLWAKNNINIKHVDYAGFNVEIANIFNMELFILQKLFPDAISRINYVARMDFLLKSPEYIIGERNDFKDFFKDGIKNIKPIKILDKKVKSKFSIIILDPEKFQYVRNISKTLGNIPNVLFNAYLDIGVVGTILLKSLTGRANTILIGDYSGIYVNPSFAKNGLYAKLDYILFDILEKHLRDSNNIEGLLHHEISHLKFVCHDKSQREAIFMPMLKECRKNFVRGQVNLSLRALINLPDFYSEGFREYFGCHNPRFFARLIAKESQNMLQHEQEQTKINIIYA